MNAIGEFAGGENGVWDRAKIVLRRRLDSMPMYLYERRIAKSAKLLQTDREELENFREGKVNELSKPLYRKIWRLLGLDVSLALGELNPLDKDKEEQWKQTMSEHRIAIAAFTGPGLIQECGVDVRTFVFVKATQEFLFDKG